MQGQQPRVEDGRPKTDAGTPRPGDHLSGIDSLRFVSAAIVLLSHLHLLPDVLHAAGKPLWQQALVGLFNGLFNGPAAVILFFVISGFCIHFPFRDGRKLAPAPYLARRMLRILPPAVVFFAIQRYGTGNPSAPVDTVLWSVWCEVIYYVLYPGLLRLRRVWSWGALLWLSYGAAAIAFATHLPEIRQSSNQFTALRWSTWVLGLPCWILGCWVAENFRRFPVPTRRRIWTYRILLLGLGVVLHVLQTHGRFLLTSYCFTLPACAPLAALWFAAELLWHERDGTVAWLERAGRGSYSIYLAHPLVVPLLALVIPTGLLLDPRWHPLLLASAGLASAGFYLVVERPSHRLARRAGRRLESRPGRALL